MNKEYIFVTFKDNKIIHIVEIGKGHDTTLCIKYPIVNASYYGFEIDQEEDRYLYINETRLSAALLHNGEMEGYPKEQVCSLCVQNLYI